MRNFYDSGAALLDGAGALEAQDTDGQVTEDLLALAVRGDARANERLYSLVSPFLYRRISWRVVRREDAEDILQETCLKIFTCLSQLRSADRFYPWAASICDSRIADWYRLRRRETGGQSVLPLTEEDWEARRICPGGPEFRQPEETAQYRELAVYWHEVLGRLTDKQRSVLYQRHLEHLKYREIARAEGVSINTVKSRYAAAVKRMRTALAAAMGLDVAELLSCLPAA